MEFTKALSLRQSTRAYTGEQITENELSALLNAGMAAPTCMGRFERVHLTVVQDPAVLEELNTLFQNAVGDSNAYPTYHAPTVIYVSNSLEDDEIVAGANASCVMENMMLSAADQGLASVYLFGVSQALLSTPRVAELLRLPEGFRTVAAMAVGHAAQPLAPRVLPSDRIAVTRI
jgi:nitroreductase